MWQDIVITVIQLVFVLALIPTVAGKEKPALSTGIVTAAALSVLAATIATLGLWYGAASTAAVGATWWIIAFQSWRRKLRTKQEGQVPAQADRQ